MRVAEGEPSGATSVARIERCINKWNGSGESNRNGTNKLSTICQTILWRCVHAKGRNSSRSMVWRVQVCHCEGQRGISRSLRLCRMTTTQLDNRKQRQVADDKWPIKCAHTHIYIYLDMNNLLLLYAVCAVHLDSCCSNILLFWPWHEHICSAIIHTESKNK